MKVNTCVFCNFDLPLVDEVNYKELFIEHLEHIKREEEQTMKNNWKEDFYEQFIECEKRENGTIAWQAWNDRDCVEEVVGFIESLLAEQKKESYEEGFNEGKKLVCNGKCSFYNGNLTGYDSGCYVHNLSLNHHD